MNNCNVANLFKLGKLLKITFKNKQLIIQESQKDYATLFSLRRLLRN